MRPNENKLSYGRRSELGFHFILQPFRGGWLD